MGHEKQALWERITETPFAPEGGNGWQRLSEFQAEARSADRSELLRLLDKPAVRSLFAGIFQSSPYLSTLITQNLARVERLLSTVPEAEWVRLCYALQASMALASDAGSAKKTLRVYKNEIALLTALADLGGVWPVMTVTDVLSRAADATVASSVRYLFSRACEAGKWRSPDPARAEVGSGYFILAMGKQGAFELNYSSDIDLIVFFDRERSRLVGDGDLQSFFVRLTRDLVSLMEERTPDGYVFRTDLRLRPDAGATQVALSTVAAHGYYETVGQNWERAAMIKARVCGGDIEVGEIFLDELKPFVWRKYLDYAAIADVHAMKRQIHAHKGIGEISILGQNIKLGRGGIREVEFFVQTQQLIAGGRQNDLRVRDTLGALHALQQRGWVQANVAADMEKAYLYLRRLEHRLQMIADEQTQEMPSTQQGLEQIAHFCGHADTASFSDELRSVLKTVERHYAGLFEDAPELTGTGTNMVFAGATDDPKTIEELKKLGYSQPEQVLAIVRGWHHGRTPSVRSPRARERLTEVQPLLIAALADTVEPDAAIASFDRFLAELPSGVQLFSLLKANPSLIRLIADIMGTTPRLSRILSTRRRLLDAVLDPQALQSATDREEIDRILQSEFAEARRLAEGDPMQDILDRARVIGGEQGFLIGVRILTGSISADEAGAAYALVAERMVAALLAEVCQELEREHGKVPGGGAAVIAMGKLGGREMTASSDLDLILVYDYEEGAAQSDGPRPLAPSHYYTRVTQRLITALSAPTAEGTLYEVDMRLRPSGQKGPVATKLSGFVSYQISEAWTWEHMAMTRARVIAGDADVVNRLEEAILEVLKAPRDREKVATDVREMRERIAAEKGTDNIWNLKQVRGGLVDLEFIAQYLQLVGAAKHPEILDQNTLIALEKLSRAGALSPADATDLISSGRLLHDLTQIVRLSLDHAFDPKNAPAGLKALLARAVEKPDFEAVENDLKSALDKVKSAFDRLVV
ncbi:MAG: bifunctional [glutamine synthetase] adenylyltransferase/[glutamine synthetase]-adenylyl-L-tyrosine phosphorylase [Hyphomicrobiaceae bacterium]|nr:bifunctional [glutamine synthetase] adenylyltransferase/[glutamine synthetase]-adenylyl-L-tyrosine phosphorylase [Hyphomicrobiaceae bacterium]